MKTFLVKNKKPLVRWSYLNDGSFFKGKIPKGHDLAINPSKGIIVIDVDNHGIDGLSNIPTKILDKLMKTAHYPTKNGGIHFWLEYTGGLNIMNKSTTIGIDIRTHKGYAIYYPKKGLKKFLKKIIKSDKELNNWIKKTFTNGRKNK